VSSIVGQIALKKGRPELDLHSKPVAGSIEIGRTQLSPVDRSPSYMAYLGALVAGGRAVDSAHTKDVE